MQWFRGLPRLSWTREHHEVHIRRNAEVVPGSDFRTVARISYFKCNKLGNFADFYPARLEANKQHHINAIKLNVGSMSKTLTKGEGTGHIVNEGVWMNTGLIVTQEGNVSKEE